MGYIQVDTQNLSLFLQFCSAMAKLIILFTIFSYAVAAVAVSGSTGEFYSFSKNVSPKATGDKEEKMTQLHFYYHDIVSGTKPTAVVVAEAAGTSQSATSFGKTLVMDDPLTEGPELSSKLVGRAQGMYAWASQEEAALLMVKNFAFLDGEYNGSTIAIFGRNAILSEVREMPVVGGSGIFRFARGYAEERTHTFNAETGDAVVEYDVYVSHY